MTEETLLGSLKKALEMEENGYKFYKDISQKSKNEITKKAFDFLAKNEVFHIENIKNFYNTMKEKGEFPEITLSKDEPKREKDFKIFFKDILELNKKVAPDDNDEKAYEFAMELENDGYNFYKNMLDNTKDQNLVMLLEFLLKEEKAHYEQIEDLYSYITDSENWFMYDEGSFPQG